MRYVEEEMNTYFYVKLFQAITYNIGIQEFLSKLDDLGINIIVPDTLMIARDCFQSWAKHPGLSEHSVSNIQYFANHCRFHENAQYYKAEIFDICNSIISICNNIKPTEEGCYKIMKKRYIGLGESLQALFDYSYNRKSLKEEINVSIEMDWIILVTHSDFYNDEEFNAESLAFLHNPMYLKSIEYLTREMPQLFKDEEFRNRVKKIIRMNDKMGKESKKVYRKSGMSKRNRALKSYLK